MAALWEAYGEVAKDWPWPIKKQNFVKLRPPPSAITNVVKPDYDLRPPYNVDTASFPKFEKR